MTKSQKFINKKTGVIKTQIPITEIADWEKFDGCSKCGGRGYVGGGESDPMPMPCICQAKEEICKK